MGPIALFDKSFLQSLSIDEAVWFDHFFVANIAPLFYVETLADLEKAVREGRTPEAEVGSIADKTPVMHGAPSANHLAMGVAELLGNRIPMHAQVPVAGGHFVKSGNERGVVFKGLPEAEAYARWQRREFLEVERKFARAWRQALAAVDLGAVASGLRSAGINASACRSLAEAHEVAVRVVAGTDRPFDRIGMAIAAVGVPRHLHEAVVERWIGAGKPALSDYAPFVAHVLTVELFFQIAVASHLIGSERSSNLADIAYLFHLPHCMLFTSGDALHRRTAPIFLRSDQQFVWAPDLKAELRRVNEEFMGLPEATKELGIMAFARVPPGDPSLLLPQIWDRHFPGYRERRLRDGIVCPVRDEALAHRVEQLSNGVPLSPSEIDFDPQDADALVIERMLSKRRGSWWQLPKALKTEESGQ